MKAGPRKENEMLTEKEFLYNIKRRIWELPDEHEKEMESTAMHELWQIWSCLESRIEHLENEND